MSALITGDLGVDAESELVFRKSLPDVDILVVGHHGSSGSTSPALLYAVTPELALISVGPNSYGHPTDRVLTLLEAADCTVMRTDISGDIIVKEDRNGQEAEAHRQKN